MLTLLCCFHVGGTIFFSVVFDIELGAELILEAYDGLVPNSSWQLFDVRNVMFHTRKFF